MEKIRNIYDDCDKSLSSMIKPLKEALSNLSKEKNTSMQIYHQQSMAFVDLVKNWQECNGLAKLIMKCYEFYLESESEKLMTDIQGYMNQYQKCKSRILLVIGSLKECTDISSQLDVYMDKCDALSNVGKLMTNIVGEMDLLKKKSPKNQMMIIGIRIRIPLHENKHRIKLLKMMIPGIYLFLKNLIQNLKNLWD